MRSVRIQPVSAKAISIDIVCDCGRNGLKSQKTGEKSFRHLISLNGKGPAEPMVLACECGKHYHVIFQGDHVHINSL